MKIFVETVDGKKYELERISEIAFDDASDAACACLSVTFSGEEEIPEIDAVKAYHGDELVFNGFCDCQKSKKSRDGFEQFIYARSSASLLLDNEAKPFTYLNATAGLLFDVYARELGFKNRLPDISCETLYEVQKGSSCFGAINQFVSLLTGERIYISPKNEIMILKSDAVLDADGLDIICAEKAINRSEPLSSVRFKRDSAQYGYSVVTRSDFGTQKGIKREKYVNLGSLPKWQRDFTVLKKLKASYERYNTVELTVSGYEKSSLFTNVRYTFCGGEPEDYILYEKKYYSDKNGERTKLMLRKNIDVKEITYVD